ncbi:uncharacterized protein LOC123322706 isoform X2 [Coccinella septempunctata]|uniref:uncharacterized protein LOC123322706 isoform X2 n=1 Tax=Coccinella septempunctata TaxID=41139 RepID=UPI001D090A31|nr:uncharacterized protein LOC123322706 isoform X2 [Coccinella septempunctata]
MAEKRPISRLALKNISTNIPLKKVKEDAIKNDVPPVSATKPPAIAQKTTLAHKINERLTRDDEAILLEEQLYKEGYQRDYIRFLLHDEKRFVLDRNFLQTTVFTTTSRYSVVNLLLKMQQYFRTPDNEYYMAVKLMDLSSKICTEPEPREGILLAITSFWIVHKFLDSNIFISLKSILKFLRLIPGMHHRYRMEDVLKMERRVLTFTKFTVQLPDPSIFIEHFLRKLKLIPNKPLLYIQPS